MLQARRSWPFISPAGPQLMTRPTAEGSSFCCGTSAPTVHGSSSHEAVHFRLTSRADFPTGPINSFRRREAVGPPRPLCSRVRCPDPVETLFHRIVSNSGPYSTLISAWLNHETTGGFVAAMQQRRSPRRK